MSAVNTGPRIGLSCALSTAFKPDGSVDLPRTIGQAKWVLANGGDGVTMFGTTGEGASIDLAERHAALGALAGAGFDFGKTVIAGVTAATVADAVAQAQAGYDYGCRALLMTPPFYFPDPSEEGTFRWFAAVFERLGARLRDVLVYHIPSMTRVGFSAAAMARLRKEFPGAVIGIKDSTGSWDSAKSFLDAHKDLQILVGDERLLARAVREGGSGSICGLANLRPDLLRPAAWDGTDDPRIAKCVESIVADPFMPAVKALIAHREKDAEWRRMRAPVVALDDARVRALVARFEAAQGAQAA
ncbi:MAG: dihydrodipicolinate synthase family protein [Azospirillum sp.]|nr:dihydrodipicolinate synthase family protein [Azospirillum sp.]MCZ8122744.1 dihydrodipicolinate synthase family protein [Magnetospirillum sp.]